MPSARPLLGLVVLPLVLLSWIWLATPTTSLNQGRDADGRAYAAMAEGEAASSELGHTQPWCWRVLTPLLARQIPLPTVAAFRLLAFLSDWLSLALLTLLLGAVGLSAATASFGVLLYAGVFWTLKFSFFSPCYIDFQTQPFLIGACLLMVRRRWRSLPLVLAVGVAQKETALLMAPLAALHAWRSGAFRGRRALLYLALLVLPALAVLAALRLAIRPVNQGSTVDLVLAILRLQLPDPKFWLRLLAEIPSALGLLPALLVFRRHAALRFARTEPAWGTYLIVGSLLPLLGIDKARLFLFVLPAVVVVSAVALEPVLARGGARVGAWIAVTLCLHLYLGHHFTPIRSHMALIERMAPTNVDRPFLPHLAAGVAVYAVWAAATLGLRPAGRDRDAS